MTLATNLVPTAAERVRTICGRANGALLAVDGAESVTTPIHHVLDDGTLAVAIPGNYGADASPITSAEAMLELADYAPLQLRAPVRSLVWIGGRLQQVPSSVVPAMLDLIAAEDPNPALLCVETSISGSARDPDAGDIRYRLLRLQIASVVVADATGAESVDVAPLIAARPDPFTAIESCWLQHLDSAHSAVVARLASRLPAALRRGHVRLLSLDRYGVQLRIESDRNDLDVRLPFHKPVDDATGLGQAIRMLIGCPFANGLRARRC